MASLRWLDPAHGLRRVKRWPPVQAIRRSRAHAFFLSPQGAIGHFGVYPDFAAARATLPVSTGFDTASLADEYTDERTQRVFPYDYPVMWWLGQAFSRGACRVWDIGGSVGVHYHAYREYLDYPAALQWRVSELPAIAEIGRQLAVRRGARGLVFTDRLAPADADADIWLCAGALHFIESGRLLGPWLHEAAPHPVHILLNKLPLYDGPTFVSTQNIGHGAFAPHYVYGRADFIASVEAEGYVLEDAWAVLERQFGLFDDPQRSFGAYCGLYFRLASSASSKPAARRASTLNGPF
jgi:putative methyltransferase (TIGR04325 family)